MKTSTKNIPKITSFPCLMEFRLQGKISVGIYLVNEYENMGEDKYSVCLVSPHGEDVSDLGQVYFKSELNPSEWFFLPAGTQVNLIN
jgi:hypothetical protein